MNSFKQLFIVFFILSPLIVFSEPYNEGPKKCKECHEAEYIIWKESQHYKAYKDVHKKPEAKEILKVVGGGKTMKKNKICSTCHYTKIKKTAEKPAKSKFGPSCESCHGSSSEYRKIHHDYGGKGIKAVDETPEHKEKRYSDSIEVGMIWSFMHFDVAMNCMGCHGLARTDIDGEILGKMMAAKHPAKSKFELVQYSQGSVRHRFYLPDQKINKEMSASELARLYIIGQAAILVSAYAAGKAGTDNAYKAFQKERADKARMSLSTLSNIPEIQTLLNSPSEIAGRRMSDKIKDMDLSAEVSELLPTKLK